MLAVNSGRSVNTYKVGQVLGTTQVSINQIEGLVQEINLTISAISRNSLQEIEVSLERQETLCTSLRHLVQTLADTGELVPTGIRSAIVDLHQINRNYRRLLDQSRSSHRLLFALSRSYAECASRDAPVNTGTFCSLEV